MWDQYVCFGEESTWGTEVARAEFHRSFEDGQMTPNVPFRRMNMLGEADPVLKFKEVESGGMTIAVPAVYDGMGTLLKHAMGNVTTTGSGPYVHAFVLDDNPYTRASSPLIGLSAEQAYQLPLTSGHESQLLTGGRFASWGFAFAQNEEVKFTGELSGKTVAFEPVTGTPSFPDYGHATTSPLVLPSQCVVNIDGGGAESVDSFEFTVNNALRTDRSFLGSSYVTGARRQGLREITGSIEMRYINELLSEKWLNQTSASLTVTCTGTGTDDMTFTFAKIYFTGDPLSMESGEDQGLTLPFTAYKTAAGANDALTIDVTNSTATAV